jgi:hypothetical protein
MVEADSTVRKTVARLCASFQISDRAAIRLQCSVARIAGACDPRWVAIVGLLEMVGMAVATAGAFNLGELSLRCSAPA